MKSLNLKILVANALVASVYVALSMLFMPVAFNAVQFRISELLNLLPFFNPSLGVGLIVGCFITNLSSPFGFYDIVFGTLSTAFTVFCISRTKSLFIATLWPTVFSITIGIMISFLSNSPLIVTTLSVMAGQFIISTIIGFPFYKALLRNRWFINLVKLYGIREVEK